MEKVYRYVPDTTTVNENVTLTRILPNYDDHYILCKTGEDKYILLKEDCGFIFRRLDDRRYGHTGTHKTVQGAIDRARSLGADTEIYYGKNFEELWNRI